MASPFLGEIRIFAGNFAPRGWALCNGQLLPISQNTALFSLLGTTYGGDGKSNFALPDLQGRAPLHQGQGPGLTDRPLGSNGGAANETLSAAELPAHAHAVQAYNGGGAQQDPAGAVWATGVGARGLKLYSASAGTGAAMSPQAFASAGGSQPHNNMPPYLVLTFIIAMQGIYPSRN